MGTRGLLGYRDAVALLGVDPPGLVALDEALGGALSVATGGASETVLNLAGAQGRILRLGRDVFGRLRESLGAADRVGRTQQLEAAHAVLVVTAYFEVLGEVALPFDWTETRLTRREQLALAGSAEADARSFVHAVASTAAPMPAPHLPYEAVLGELGRWYALLEGRLLRFLRGLALWDRLTETERAASTARLSAVTVGALDRYQEPFARLAADIPEFGLWAGRTEHQATRAAVRTALSTVEALLNGLAAAAAPPVDVAAALSTAYRATLGRRILAEADVATDAGLPTVADSYLDPQFRVRATDGTAGTPAEEDWWSGTELRGDLCEYLAGAFTGPGTAAAPMVVLGQPGAGKSMLTKVLAARLHAAGFLPVRVVLREIPTEADVQEQIEYAVRSATGEHVTWPELIRAAPGAVPLVLFDGFDELLQATGVSQSDFLMRIAAFQQRESDQGRPVIVLVTTR